MFKSKGKNLIVIISILMVTKIQGGQNQVRMNDQQLNKPDQTTEGKTAHLCSPVSLGSRHHDILPKDTKTCWIFEQIICIQDG